ncbi:hypothetical protein Tco_0201437 [Tanacetum coccineum]
MDTRVACWPRVDACPARQILGFVFTDFGYRFMDGYQLWRLDESEEHKETFIGVRSIRRLSLVLQHLARELFRYREDNNEDAIAVVEVEEIYAHESLTFNDTFSYEEVDINKKTENQAKMTKLSMEWKRLCKIKAKVQKCQSQSQYRRISSQTGAGTEEYCWMQS